MEEKMVKLLEICKGIDYSNTHVCEHTHYDYEDDDEDDYDDGFGNYTAEFDEAVTLDEETREVLEHLCSTLFIRDNGDVDCKRIRDFKKRAKNIGLDLEIIPGEMDSFGWLTGCLVTNNQETLVYCFG